MSDNPTTAWLDRYDHAPAEPGWYPVVIDDQGYSMLAVASEWDGYQWDRDDVTSFALVSFTDERSAAPMLASTSRNGFAPCIGEINNEH